MHKLLLIVFGLFLFGCKEQEQKIETPKKEITKTETPKTDKPVTLNRVVVDFTDIREHFSLYPNSKIPQGNTVYVCSAYGCNKVSRYTFKSSELENIKEYFVNVTNAKEERLALANAISFIEVIVGEPTGTKKDRPSLDISGNGDPSQLDCVDEATNVTSYLIMMNNNNMLRFHNINKPNWKGGFFKWTHYAAVITDRETNIKWAIDAGVGRNGDKPLIKEYSKWYE